ncbi:hypothetical protein DFJ73DRAFT_849000 [Zopfochytrium polystomum]|nr:hypothetical protein DFJ73DRAFT_849000 [Zopfochytrium polystomum]
MFKTYRYLKTSFYEYPTFFTAWVLGIAGCGIIGVVFPIRREMGYARPLDVPRTYPMPQRARVEVSGYDD